MVIMYVFGLMRCWYMYAILGGGVDGQGREGVV